MGKNSFKLIFFTNLYIVFSLLFAHSALAAVLRWSPVASTDDCVIEGYRVHYGIISGQYTNVANITGQNNTSFDLDTLELVSAQTYYFAVSAYSTTNQEGPLSSPIPYTPYTASPYIEQYPVVNHTSNIIDVTFSESNMLGADNQNNYEFIPSILFEIPDADIIMTGRTFRLVLSYIPEQTIITMNVSNVTDSDGNSLISDSIILNDNDNDNMADDWEAYYGVTTAFLDPDSDGLENIAEFQWRTNPVDSDSDADGMDDGWEVQNSLNPVVDDANGDIDGDGISNLEEYNQGTGVSNKAPEKPVLNQPCNSCNDIELTPHFVTNSYVDHENDGHIKTQWQISTEQTFTIPENILYERETYQQSLLTTMTLPEFILGPGTTYFWRVKFFDATGYSLWSEPFSFTTIAVNPEDSDGDGVPDIQQVLNGTIDLDNDGNLDVSSDSYKIVTNGNTSFALETSNNVISVDCLKLINPDDISDSVGKPGNLDVGLIQFKLRVNNHGDTAIVKIYFSESVGTDWYKYDLINGWTEYSSDYPNNVNFSSDRKSVLLTLVDGGAGDSDGVANGIIIDPSGPGGSSPEGYSALNSADGGGGGGCFIATAAFGSPMEKHVQILKDFRDIYLLKSRPGIAFVKTYYKYSPQIADVIAQHGVLKSIVKAGLMPFVLFGYIAISTSIVQQIMILLLIISFFAITITYYRRNFIKAR